MPGRLSLAYVFFTVLAMDKIQIYGSAHFLVKSIYANRAFSVSYCGSMFRFALSFHVIRTSTLWYFGIFVGGCPFT